MSRLNGSASRFRGIEELSIAGAISHYGATLSTPINERQLGSHLVLLGLDSVAVTRGVVHGRYLFATLPVHCLR